ncbi:MAG: leucine-rich repeat domain-containing protein, partial [Thermoguttaceae bacterium]|nr:leucine-rich repeat domain-containing protein [Thermoguttaceae bacterium]
MTSQPSSLPTASPNRASDFAWRPLPTGGAVIVGFTNDAPEMVVPAEIEGRPVVAILECAFNHHPPLRSLTLPASVEYFLESINDAPSPNAEFRPFGLFAFFRCTELSEILVVPENKRFRSIDGVLFTADGKTLALYPKGRSGAYAVPPGVERIAQYAFSDARLSSVALSDDVQRIDNSVFFGCNHLKTIEFGANSSLREIGAQAFERCASFANVAFPDSLEKIGARAFEFCHKLTEVFFNPNLKEIDADAFAYCDALERASFGPRLERIGGDAFDGCSSLAQVDLPPSVREIGSGAFTDCKSLTQVVLPRSLRKVEASTFSGCKTLANVSLPNELEEIGDRAFEGCKPLTQISLPKSLQRFNSQAFNGCANLSTFELSPANRNFRVVDGGLLSADGKTLWRVPPMQKGAFVVPNGVEKIAPCAFLGCKALAAIEFPDSLQTVGDRAFDGCQALAKIAIPRNVKTLGEKAFNGCKSLASLTFAPDSTLETVGKNAFANCKLLVEIS